MRKLLFVALALGTASGAWAQDTSFRGFRLEGNAGWDWSHVRHNGGNDKFGFGGEAGFDGQIGDHIVIGPEFDYWQPNRRRNTIALAAPAGAASSLQARDQVGAALRIGYLANPDLLIYGKGGYVNEAQRAYFLAPPGGISTVSRYHVDGYQAGGGIEYTLHDRFSFAPSGVYVSAQYVYDRFDNRTTDQHAMGGIGIRLK